VTEPVGTRRSRGAVRNTEIVYRLYETVDELSTVIENARSVPMSGSCMVPRDHVLDLLDDLRESLPEDVQSAGAIVEQRTEILQAAQAEAELLTRRTRGEADQLVASASRQREEVLGVARRQRDEILARAQEDADALIAQAEREAERLVEEGRRRRDALVAEGQAEHERLVTETEVYQTALAQSDELGAATQAEVARMRTEVDAYVDTRLADFGSTLERMVRSVEAARSTLRAP
jgi:cell division septum initiation protein DivIVA